MLADIETSRITFLRKWLSGWSKREQARVLAASATLLQKEASALSSATQSSQDQQITAHLVRGYQHASQGDDEKAFEEFEAAASVTREDVVSRDIAAGWARKLNRQQREFELLAELHEAAKGHGDDLHGAMALRRHAELLNKRQSEADWVRARDKLNNARALVEPLFGEREGRRELGRVLTLFCEVQCSRTVVGALGPRSVRMRQCMAGEDTLKRAEEPNGEVYGAERAAKAEQRISELRGDVIATGDEGDQGDEVPRG